MTAIFDLHVDSIIQQKLFRYNVLKKHRAGVRGQPLFWHADIPRMLEAQYAAVCMGIHYFPWESEAGWRSLNNQIDYLDRIAQSHPDCTRVFDRSDWQKFSVNKPHLLMAPGVEGAHMLNKRLERVEILAQRKVAYLTLTHFSKNAAATPSMGLNANENDGLTAFGRDLISELNRFNIVIDVAHLNTPGVLDVCKHSKAPVACTHTGVKGVFDHPRNITDEEIDGIAQTNGIIGVIFAPGYLTGKLRASTDCVLDHIDYIVDRVGIRHVALGSDYDGWLPAIPNDHRDCRDITRVIHGLQARGYTQDEIDRIAHKNAARIFGILTTESDSEKSAVG